MTKPGSMTSSIQAAFALVVIAWLGLGYGNGASAQAPVPAAPKQAAGFEFGDDERLILLGNTVIEREQKYGFIEAWLTLALGDKKLTVRNLGWSGDTVFGHARSYFGPPKEGIERLSGHLDMLKPTSAILCYGSEMAFERLGGLPDFLSGYRELLEVLRQKAPGIRIILLSPPPLEDLGRPLPDQVDANQNLASLADALQKFARMQNCYFVDWFQLMGGVPKKGRAEKPLTENGVHYTEEGYRALAAKLLEGLGVPKPEVPEAEVDGLRKLVSRKDQLFFNRWRPANEIYLFGARKHEQGQNAKEIPMFDKLIEEADAKIQQSKRDILAAKKRL